jgi:predicted transposase YbfD/YdcC
MDADHPRGVARFFDEVEDPRIHRTKRHALEDILMIALVAILGGADAWTEVEAFGRAKVEWFARFLKLPHGIPSHDTFGRVFARLDPAPLSRCLARWVEHLSTALNVKTKTIAIDGKTLRASGDAANGAAALHLLSAWSHEARLVIGQLACDGKSNEITAIHELIEMLDIAGCVITVDAMHTQKNIAEAILDRESDYVMALKDNQPTLCNDVALMIAEAEEAPRSARFDLDDHTTEEDSHGRIEQRHYTTLTLDKKRTWRIHPDRWPGLKAIGRIERQRTDKTTGETTMQIVYYLMSQAMDIRRFADAVRGHWGIENSLHWVLDVTFNEDRCRCRKDHSHENFALMRKLALNLLDQNRKRCKLSIRAQRLKIGWNIDFIQTLLNPEK